MPLPVLARLATLSMALFAAFPMTSAAQVDLSLLTSMKARSVGPSGQGGRINAIDALVEDPNVIYVGAAAGGVWRSRNAGTTWEPLFDDQPVQSIGALAVDQRNPDVIWVGT
ncbi:MAG: hypothetical protein OXU33_03425, partial [Gemmatimonadota bacterium]|nr:hypothetical protein [Gemmatimonadota bacterium]